MGLFDLRANDLAAHLPGPTLLYLPGPRDAAQPALFVSVLLHGNETSGWDAVRRVAHEELARPMVLFIGNVDAAAQGVRTLAVQQDYNRIWRNGRGEEGRLARELLRYLRTRPLFAALDIHNNTGHNPHYSVLTKLTPANLNLAYLFSDHAVFIEEPDSVLTKALEDLCPAFTIEAGPVGDVMGEERAYELIHRLLLAPTIATTPCPELLLYRAVARVHIGETATFDFADHHDSQTDLTLTAGIEAVNFHDLGAGAEFGRIRRALDETLIVLDPDHHNVTSEFFSRTDQTLHLKRAVTPAMFTTDTAVVRQDCLGYFMEKFEPGGL